MQWSDDGEYLYVATNRRVLMHRVLAENGAVPSLGETVCREVWDGNISVTGSGNEDGDLESEIMGRMAKEMLAGKKWAGHWSSSKPTTEKPQLIQTPLNEGLVDGVDDEFFS
ncbi:hypothetical protein HK100_010343 [Physocladia obscura]|uniref:Uncharacterized protein n=1 Tax=Physocladia obscura TaxID=109957 RepID=A0AAD5XAR5_9FUNG|nr:hypothetical protein HK100_010343 [Physocladia obscura]